MSAKGGSSRSTSYAGDPTLYLYTSLTAASSHITTATSRLETILRGNRLDFKPVDLAADEKARTLWRRRAGGKKLPGLVKYGTVIGNIDEIDEWNEQEILLDKIQNVPGRKPLLDDKPAESASNNPSSTDPPSNPMKKDKPVAAIPDETPAAKKQHRRFLSDAEFEDLLNEAKADNPDAATIDALLRESERRKSLVNLKDAAKPVDKNPEDQKSPSQPDHTPTAAKQDPVPAPADNTTEVQEPNGLAREKVGEENEKEASVAETPKYKEVSDDEIARAQAAQAKNIAAASEAAAKKAKEQNRAKLLAAAGRSTVEVEQGKPEVTAETPVAVPETEKAEDEEKVKDDAVKEDPVKEDPVKETDDGNADAVKAELEEQKKEEAAPNKTENADVLTKEDAKDEPALKKAENVDENSEQPEQVEAAIDPPTQKEDQKESDIPEKADAVAPLHVSAVKEEDDQDKIEAPEPKSDEVAEKQPEKTEEIVEEKAEQPQEELTIPKLEDISPKTTVPEVAPTSAQQPTPVVDEERPVEEDQEKDEPKVAGEPQAGPQTFEAEVEMTKPVQLEEEKIVAPMATSAPDADKKAGVRTEPAEHLLEDADVSLDELIRQHNLAAEYHTSPIVDVSEETPAEDSTAAPAPVAPAKDEAKAESTQVEQPQQPLRTDATLPESAPQAKNAIQRKSTVKSNKIPSELFTNSDLDLDFHIDLDKISAYTAADKEQQQQQQAGGLRPSSPSSSIRPYSTLVESSSEKEKDPGLNRRSFIPRHRHTRTTSSTFSAIGETRAAKRRNKDTEHDETESATKDAEGSRSLSLSAPSQSQSQSQYSVPTEKGTNGVRSSTEAPATGAAADYFASSATDAANNSDPPRLVVTSNGSTSNVPVAFSEIGDLDLSLNLPATTPLPQRPASSTGVSPAVSGSANSVLPDGATSRKPSRRRTISKSLSVEAAPASKEKGRKMLEGKKGAKKDGKSHCFCM